MISTQENKKNRFSLHTETWSDHRLFLVCLIISLLFMAVYFKLFYPYFETNDDMTVARFVDGSRGGYDPHIIIQHTFLGYILCFLYQLAGTIAWYTVLQYALAVVSMAAIGFALCRMLGTLGWPVFLFLELICSYECFISIQYTRTGGLAAVAGTCLLLTAFVREGRQLKLSIFGYVLLTFAFLYRSNMTVTCMLLMFPAILLHFLEDKRSWKSMLRRGSCFVLTAGILFGFLLGADKLCYSSDYWKAFRAFDNARIELLDYGFPPFTAENEAILAEYGITSDAYLLFSTWAYADPEVFTTEALEAMAALKPEIDYVNKVQLKTFLKTVPITLLRKHVIILILAAALFWLLCSRHDRRDILMVLAMICLQGAIYYYLYCSNRWAMNRIAFPMFMADTLCLLLMYRPHRSIAGDETTDSANRGRLVRLGILSAGVCALFVSMFAGCFEDFSLLFRSSNQAQVLAGTSEGLKRFVMNSYQDTEHFYICNVGTLYRDGCYGPFDIAPKDALTNFLQLGGWSTYTPQYLELMEEKGITNPMRDFVDSDEVLLITNQIGLMINYLEAQLDCTLEYEIIPAEELSICDDMPVVRVYTVND